jgi:hypothetical protein
MKNKSLSLLTLGIFSFLVVSGSVRAVHNPNHFPDPTPAQIEKFCKEYPNKKPSEQLQLKKQYDKYCKKPKITPIVKKPVITPIVKKPVITRLAIKGKCVTAKDEIRILGRDFGKQGSVRLRHDGKESPLKARRWAPTDIRIVLSGKIKPGKRYTLSVKTAGGKSNQKALVVCKKKSQLPVIAVPEPGLTPLPGKADLTVKLKSPKKATVGKAIPKLRMEAKNQGKAQAKGFTLELVLSKYRGITKRTGLMMKADGQVLETIRLTTPLDPNGRKDYFPKARLPAGTPAGKYYLCARIDPANKVKESKENNNTHCKRIEVAAAKKDAPAVAQRGPKLREGIFGRQAGLAAGKDFKPELKAPNIQPGQRQLTDMHMALTINGSPFLADITVDGTANIYWNFPRTSYVGHVYLRIKRGTIAPRDPKCPPRGTSESAGRSLMDGWDSGDLGLPGRGEHGGRVASITLSPDGRYDLSQYEVGQTYSIVACGMKRTGDYGRDGDYIYSLGSNVVTMRWSRADAILRPGVGLPESSPRPEVEHFLAGRVWIQASGAAPRSGPDDPRLRGGSLVGDGEVFFGYPGFNVLIRKGPLSIHGYVPGTRDDYAYVLVVTPHVRFPYCRNAAHTASPMGFVSAVSGDAVVDKPDIAGDGWRTRLRRAESTRTLYAHVLVPQDSRTVLTYYVRLYVVGTSPPGSGRAGLQAVCSNVVTVRIAPSR